MAMLKQPDGSCPIVVTNAHPQVTLSLLHAREVAPCAYGRVGPWSAASRLLVVAIWTLLMVKLVKIVQISLHDMYVILIVYKYIKYVIYKYFYDCIVVYYIYIQ